MNDKKSDDHVVRMPDTGYNGNEKDAFVARPSQRRSLAHGANGLAQSMSKLDNSPPLSILAYCLSSISMTVVNKYVVSGSFWNLNFFYLGVQVSRDLSSRSVDTRSLTCRPSRPLSL
jgi:GDP-mannose transporter